MKISMILKTFVFVSLIATVYAGMAAIYDFNVAQNNDNADLSWTANGETSSMQFIVERKTTNTDYVNISTVPVNNSHSYKYQDRSIYKTTGITYSYQILLVDINSMSTGNPNIICSSDEKLLIPNGISGIRSTWGSIKAMFR
jgi:hypothetical protein